MMLAISPRWRILLCSLILLLIAEKSTRAAEERPPRPNLLVIAIDDLNDWIGVLNEHPQVQTPNIDKLAARGLLFTNAHVQATFCAPSRISMLSGRLPTTSGCFEFRPRYDQAETLQGVEPWPMWLGKQGYQTFGGGKIFHEGTGAGWTAKSFANVIPSGRNPRPAEPIHWPVRVWDWGPIPNPDSAMGDYNLAVETARLLKQDYDQPFLMVAGFRRPHVPLHVPEKYFETYPLEKVILPEVREDDLDDVPHPEVALTPHAAPNHAEILEKDLWKSLTQAYLASITFVDHCVGEVLAGLDEGPHRDNTIVILWSDHGFHMGEKQHWAKRTLWEETTRIPMIIAGPGIEAGTTCAEPVGLIDLYPTLVDLVGGDQPHELEGVSLLPLLDGDSKFRHPPVITSLTSNDHAARSRDFRYIRYRDGSEELYDHRNDPHEFNNLAGDSRWDSVKTELSQALPMSSPGPNKTPQD